MKPVLSAEVFAERRSTARRLMGEMGIDSLFIPVSTNLRYFTGLDLHKTERLTALVLTLDREFLIAPAFEQSKMEQMTSVDEIVPWSEQQNPYEIVADRISGVCGCEMRMWFSEYLQLESAAGDLQFVGAGDVCNKLRICKEPVEVDMIRYAIEVITDARTALIKQLTQGMSQSELRKMLRVEAEARGGAEPICGINLAENTGMAHGGVIEKELTPGTVVMIDSGVGIDGYRSDITRTLVWDGKPSQEFRRVYSIVYEAQSAAMEVIRPGITAEQVDRAGRKVIEDAGYGQYFTHRIGHGIGLEEHEPPWMSEGNETQLKAGMVFSVEPGIYLPGKFGVRIEDLILVTEEGYECLSERARSQV